MGLQAWLAGGMLLDLVLLGLLSYIIFRLRERKAGAGPAVDSKALSAVKEIQQLRGDLEENLSEKRALTTKILARLDRRLANAEELSRNLEGLLAQAKKLTPGNSDRENLTDDTRGAAVRALGAKGLSASEIASILQLPLGEVALRLKLKQGAGNAE